MGSDEQRWMLDPQASEGKSHPVIASHNLLE
jgi:hypothetical protein